jgi:MinD-like ATPase involved in chromosome partitioning or flagellar assembly
MTGSVLAVVGTKGGVGTTTTAVNLAAALDTAGVDAVVVDADLELPDVAAYLGVTHRPTVHAVLAGVATVEEAVVPGREVPGAASMAVLPGRRDLRAYRGLTRGNSKRCSNACGRSTTSSSSTRPRVLTTGPVSVPGSLTAPSS